MSNRAASAHAGANISKRSLLERSLIRALTLALPLMLSGQQVWAAEPAANAQGSAQSAAPFDPSGYWVSLITEDWRFRMVTPGRGEYQGIPLNLQAKQIADAWDPSREKGEQCQHYGAAALMRVPTRLHITWVDANTLKVETDAGMQTRLLHFGPRPADAASAAQSWQGQSQATWEGGSLKVVTERMKSGFLRRNGVPYSDQAVLTEYWDLHKDKDGSQWLVVASILEDPKYLQQPYAVSPHFKREADGSRWNPVACSEQ